MSIILKKKKGLLTPKSQAPNSSQILGGLGVGSILGASLNKELALETIIETAIENLIMDKLLLHSTRLLRGLDYFPTYCLIEGEKRVKAIYVKKRMWLNYIQIERSDIIASGATPVEFIKFMRKKRCKKIKIDREQLENII